MKKILFFLIIISCSIFNFQLGAQVFQKTFSGTNQWNDFGVSALQDTTNGEYTISGFTNSFSGIRAFLLHLDANGNTLWTKGYGGSGTQITYGHSVRRTFDGGYIIAAQKLSSGSFHYCAIRTNGNGDTLWTKTWHNGSYPSAASGYTRDVCQTTEGGFVFTGLVDANNTFGVIRTDANGNIVWTKAYGDSCALGCGQRSHAVQQTADGGFIICGYTFSFGAGDYDAYLIKTDGSGNIVWTKTYGTTGAEEAYSVRQTTDGGYIFTGYTRISIMDPAHIILVKTNSSGDLLWTKSFSGPTGEFAFSVKQTSDNGYIVAGYTYSFGAGDADVYMIRTNSAGDTLWTKVYGGAGSDYGYSVQQTTDGGFIVSGETSSFGTTGINVYFIKTDANGNSGNDGCNQWTTNTVIGNPSFITGSGGGILSSATTVYGTALTVNTPPFIDSVLTCPCNFVLTIDKNDAHCNGSNGMAWVTVNGGTGPYSFHWNDSLSQTTDTAYNLFAGQYTVTVTDFTGDTATASVTVVEPQELILVPSSNQTICNGDSVQISVTVTGGTGAYNYHWNTGAAADSLTVSPSVTTIYGITVTDINGCTDTASITVTVNQNPTVTVSNTGPYCESPGGIISLSSTGGNTYSWSGPNSFTSNQQNPVIANVTTAMSGTYTVTVTNADGCTTTDSTSVTVNPNPIVTAGNSGPYCEGATISLNTTTGSSYFWTGPNGFASTLQNPSINNALLTDSGIYSVTVTNVNGCTGTDTTYVTIVPNPVVSISPSGLIVFCNGGNITLVATSNYNNFSWSTGANTPSITVTQSGIYSVSVTGDNNCITTVNSNVTVNPTPSPVIISSGSTTFCQGDSAMLNAGAYASYLWSTGETTQSIVVDASGNYIVTVTNTFGCFASNFIQVTVKPYVNVSVNIFVYPPDTACTGETVNLTAIPVNPGTAPNYQWSVNNIPVGYNSPAYLSNSFLNGDMVICTLNSSEECALNPAKDTIIIHLYPLPDINASADVYSGCIPLHVHFFETNTTSGYHFMWEFGDGGLSSAHNPEYIYENTGSFDILLTVTSGKGCSSSRIYNNLINVYPLPDPHFNATPIFADILNPDIEFLNLSDGASYYLWNFGDGSYSNVINPVHYYNNSGTFTVWLTAFTNHGCKDSISSNIQIDAIYTFYAPACFSPDNDGINDKFKVFGYGIDPQNFNLYIYDRWGELIYQTTDIEKEWDGKRKGDIVQNGTYTWMVQFKDFNSISHQKAGTVTVIK
ncbi:MAG: gliding motility-associated C-terminal domain-containing protein [Bacteroidia bacterium]|nr:gliding motility-associated C-terminal domain-containing protein [Bacteroidia bacterium]